MRSRTDDQGMLVGRRYVLGPLLGAGGLAYIRAATDRVLCRTVAVKCMHPALRTSKEDVQRAQREAVIAAAILHPNVCAVLDAGALPDGSPFIVLERLDGGSVEQRWSGQQVPVLDALDVALQTLAGLTAAHAAQVLHRDVKPANVFVVKTAASERPLVKIIDFGAAQVPRSPEHTPSGFIVGTPHYLSPEQAAGARDLDQRVDVYGVGLLLYEMLAGRRAFEDAPQRVLLRRITRGELEPLRTACPRLPGPLEASIMRAMSVDKDSRHETARELLDELARIHEHLTGRPYTPPWALVGAPAVVNASGSDTAPTAAPIEATLPRGRPSAPPRIDAPPEPPRAGDATAVMAPLTPPRR
jgi:serine/threonine-protein kinase